MKIDKLIIYKNNIFIKIADFKKTFFKKKDITKQIRPILNN